jgi:mono/diheme cytochrome c family protein
MTPTAIVATGLATLAAACGTAPAPPLHAEAMYVRYCASCHGTTGRGDGPAAGSLDPPPPDLRTSTLNLAELMRVIDGRRTVRAHGTMAMPVWGEVFQETQAQEDPSRQHRQALRDVQALAEYVRSLQAGAR